MSFPLKILALLKKEFLIEFRQKSSIGGIFLFVVSTIFICYLSFRQLVQIQTWNALFWIIILFTAVTSSSKSFLNEQRGKELYNYQTYSPQEMIFSKIVYNTILLSFTGMLTLFFYSWFLGGFQGDKKLFAYILLFTSAALSAILTLMAGIVNKANGNFTLMAILSFPLTIPVILLSQKLGRNALMGLDFVVSQNFLGALVLLNIVVFVLAYVLFPYLWKD